MIRTASISAAVLSLSLALSACVGGPAGLGGEPPLTLSLIHI